MCPCVVRIPPHHPNPSRSPKYFGRICYKNFTCWSGLVGPGGGGGKGGQGGLEGLGLGLEGEGGVSDPESDLWIVVV